MCHYVFLWAKFRDACLELSIFFTMFSKANVWKQTKRFLVRLNALWRPASARCVCVYTFLLECRRVLSHQISCTSMQSHQAENAFFVSIVPAYDAGHRMKPIPSNKMVEKSEKKNGIARIQNWCGAECNANHVWEMFSVFSLFSSIFHINSACVYRRLWSASTKYACIQRVNSFCQSVYSFHVRRRCRRLGRIIYSFLFTALWNFIVWHFAPFR